MTASPSPVDYREMDLSPGNELLLADEQQTSDIFEPHHNDVLCGRGVTTNRHPGNESFRRLVSLNKELYVTSTKRQKMSISRSIVEAVRTLDPPGRFLDKDPLTGRWFEVGHKKAVEKTSQALRDGAASLRKQLSADLGDPDFFNAVFHSEGEQGDSAEKVDENKDEKDKKPNDEASKPKRVPDDNGAKIREKVKATAKTKQPKAKEAPVKAKKGHRRTRSTPIIGSVTAAKRVQRRSPPTEPPPSPIARIAENFCHEPPSPRSPPPRHSASHPNSPMTWGGRIRFDEGQSPGSLGSIPRHSPYEPPQSPHASPHSFSPYGHPPGPYRGGHPGYEYHGSHREHPPYQWPKKPSRYQNYPGHPSPTARLPPVHSSSPAPHSPLPSGPLPPGRHKFSPSGYQTNPHPSDYHRSEHPPPEYHRSEHPPPEWSPRVVHRHQSRYPSPRHYSPHYGGDYQAAHSPRWRGPTPQESYSSGEYSNSPLNSSSLSVPALGGEGNPHVSSSPRLMLSPRSHPSAYNQMPPRPPSYPHKEFMPPPSQPSFSSDDFSPPPPSPRYRQSSRHYPYGSAPEETNRSPRSSPVEEKKSDAGEKEEESYHPPDRAPSSVPLGSLSNTRDRRSPSTCMDKDMGEEKNRSKQERRTDEARPKDDEMYPYNATKDDDDPAADDNNSVDDIQMSPIPLDREDPSTLMELPENIMILPISPCGPKDA
eukprot:CAMPEP_0117068934 /NCGR_PEP_ID=MMETSP0472-20121206/48319_1 /TAXON_ID=693140 ORGANISM="Tiarina fusus, Strain LIS" /NCGR_SAMPLE_ID=MMETSP0472 /ASSEMBLY_ACC=CAM_ASM_000603 /LENGTH=706 /DNA_ID=CAMNT_0004791209 /DNA_START=33 /DNA_END=2153 /DNA_ORIENTATION=+